MKDFNAAKLLEGRFSTPSEYIRSLIRDDQDLAGAVAQNQEYLAERQERTQFWFISYPAVLRDTEEKSAVELTLLVEITSRKTAEAESERATLLLSAIVDSSDDAIISWNKSAERLLG